MPEVRIPRSPSLFPIFYRVIPFLIRLSFPIRTNTADKARQGKVATLDSLPAVQPDLLRVPGRVGRLVTLTYSPLLFSLVSEVPIYFISTYLG